MKLLIVTLTLLIINSSVIQGQSELIGRWKLKMVLDNSGKKCSQIKKYDLVIYPDNKYEMLFGTTSWVSGKWELEESKIKFEAATIADPCMQWRSDKELKSFEITDDGILIIDFFICGIVDGRSYFKKMKSKRMNSKF